MDLAHALLNILLILLGIVGVALIILLGLAISAILEIYALARAVRKEVSSIGSALRAIGEGIGSKAGGITSMLSFMQKKSAPKKATRKTTKK